MFVLNSVYVCFMCTLNKASCLLVKKVREYDLYNLYNNNFYGCIKIILLKICLGRTCSVFVVAQMF